MTPEHKLGYTLTERTRFKVRVVVSEGRDPVDPCTMWLRHAQSLLACQELYIAARDNSGLGGSQFGSGEVFDEAGQHIARISYNGRLWEPHPWGANSVAIAEAPNREERVQ